MWSPKTCHRPGDLVRIEEHTASTSTQKKTAKAKSTGKAEKAKSNGVEGVVYKVKKAFKHMSNTCRNRALTFVQVTDTKIVVAVDPPDTSGEDLDLPDRCRVVKLANSVTYDR